MNAYQMTTPHNLPIRSTFRRWKLRFSLRALFIVVALVGIGFTLIKRYADQSLLEKGISEQYRKMGAIVYMEPTLPAWLFNMLPQRLNSIVERPMSIDLRGGLDVCDADLKSLSHLTDLKMLACDCDKVGDQGVVWLKALKTLQELDLGGTGVTDAGAEQLCDLVNLRRFSLGFTRVSNRGIAAVRDMRSLLSLNVSAAQSMTGDLRI